ncbi:hypothetical protein [Massilia sp. METH4]|uniref:hypothetical protein n=1 Tax=Massilia sp. METH4 TaxID=3123041 RepID=UPI0030D32401
MLFVLLFSLGVLAVPLAIDISRRGKDNILRRSGRDVLNYRLVRRGLSAVNVAAGRVSAFTAGLVGLAVVALLVYVAVKGISAVTFVLSTVFGGG